MGMEMGTGIHDLRKSYLSRDEVEVHTAFGLG
jgi:hypothetical protein